MVRLKYGEFTQNPPHFAGHYFINFHFNQPTGDNYWRVYLRPGKMWFGKNMAKLSRTRHFIPVIIIPSKVLFDCSTLSWFRFLDLVAIIIDYLSTSYIATGQIKCYLLAGCILSAQYMSCERTVHQREIAHSGCTVLPPARRCWYGTLYSTPLSIYVHMSASWFI